MWKTTRNGSRLFLSAYLSPRSIFFLMLKPEVLRKSVWSAKDLWELPDIFGKAIMLIMAVCCNGLSVNGMKKSDMRVHLLSGRLESFMIHRGRFLLAIWPLFFSFMEAR